MKNLIYVLLLLSAPTAFALDDECLNRIQAVMHNLRPEAVMKMYEMQSEPIVELGIAYRVTKVLVDINESGKSTLKSVIVYERPNSKCMIRNIL